MITAAQLKQLVDLPDFVGRTVKLKKIGKHFTGRCPFHDDRTPSFVVRREKRRWNCYGCGQWGDVYDFVGLSEGVDFRAAKRRVADFVGVPLDDQDTFSDPPVALKLSSHEARAFDFWLSAEMRRLSALWRFFNQQQAACMAYLQGRWNGPDQSLDAEAVAGTHRSLNLIHEAKQQVDDRLLQLDTDPSPEIEPFLRRLYGQEDFRQMVMPQ
jgi:DNA primase